MKARAWHSAIRRLLLFGCLVTLVVSVLPIAPVAAAPKTWWVDDWPNGSDANAGTETAPFRSITYAMTKAVSGDTIMVKPGNYAAPGETFPIQLKSGVRLTSQSGATATTIDANSSAGVVSILNSAAGTELSGFTIREGKAALGGGIYINSVASHPAGWPLIADNVIIGNTATMLGGAIYVWGVGGTLATPAISDNQIDSNTAASGGGGVYCGLNASPCIDGDLFLLNRTTAGNGGAVLVQGNTGPQIIDCRFTGMNSAALNGGAIACLPISAMSMDIIRCDFGANLANVDGGAVAVGTDSTVRMRECEFEANSAQVDGGAVVVTGGTAYLWNALMHHNHAVSNGAAVRVEGGATQITNSTVWVNDMGNYGVSRSGGTCTLKNCIVGEHSGKDLYGVSVSYSLVQDTSFSGDNVVDLGHITHGAPGFIDESLRRYQLRASSPCVDAGTNAGATTKDLLGIVRPQDGDGNGTAVTDLGAYERPFPEVQRYAGTNRYVTACQAAKENFDAADTVVIASGENFPDALSAAGLAGSYEAPLLLVKKDDVPDVVLGTIGDLGATEAVVVGGPAVVSSVVMTQLEDEGLEVSRVYGDDRYQTSASVAREIARREGNMAYVFVARGDAFPDALAVSPTAYSSRCPILLTKPTSLPSAIAGLFDDYDISRAYVCGGTSAVSASVASQVETLVKKGSFISFERWAGSDRYATAVAVAEGAVEDHWAVWDYVGIATGENFPDALSGGPVAGSYEGCVLLTKTGSLPSTTAAVLKENKDIIVRAEIFGGASAVSDGVKTAAESALGW